MTIGPVSSIGPVAARPAAPAEAPGASGFADALAKGIDVLSAQEKRADSMVVRMATGQDVQPHDVMIATQKAELSLELAVAVRNKALEAYREIMNMQL